MLFTFSLSFYFSKKTFPHTQTRNCKKIVRLRFVCVRVYTLIASALLQNKKCAKYISREGAGSELRIQRICSAYFLSHFISYHKLIEKRFKRKWLALH